MQITYLDEAVKMPEKKSKISADNRIRKIAFPVFAQNVKEYAEPLLLNNIPTMGQHDECLFRFLAFSSYTEIKSAGKRFITPSLLVKPYENGYLLIIKSCGISSLNNKYIRSRDGKSATHPTIYIGSALFALDSTMEFLEEKLSEEYNTEFKVKMEIVDLGDTAGKVWLDNSNWMADIDVANYDEAESLIKNAVNMGFPCIPNEYRDIIKNGKSPSILNLVFEGGVAFQDFADFVKNRVVTPNSINEFNLILNFDDSNKNFMNSLYEDAQYCAKGLPIKITSLDISKNFYSSLSNYSNDILSKLSNVFSGASIILPRIAYEFSDNNAISKLTNGLYTKDTSRWIENKNTQLREQDGGNFIYDLIWYPITNEMCYQTADGAIYNIPYNFLGKSI